MKILFFGRHFTYFRNFESVLRELAARGHRIHLAAERDESLGGQRLVESLAAAHPGITFGDAPARIADDDAWVASRLRLGLDYLRYQHRIFDEALTLRERSRDRTPGFFIALGKVARRTGEASRRLMVSVVRRLERAVPEDPAIRDFVASHQADVVLITPLINLGSSQIEYLRAARGLRIPNALCVWSWDHLSSKALIRDWPDRVFVWNDTQKDEALRLHGVPAERVVVTGAQCFDQWFGRQPSRDRAAFCAQVGLPPDRPFLLYACSTLFDHSPPEARLVLEWIRHVRASDLANLRDVGILVRPHPSRMHEWKDVDFSQMGPTVLWGSNPLDAASKAGYFDSLYHSAAVVGLITSAFIEAGIVGRPVYTLLVPEFEDNQLGTVHFHYLTKTAGGLLHVGRGFDEHLRQLDAAVAAPVTEVKPFIRAFVRPHGLEVAATPLFAGQVEALGRSAPYPLSSSVLDPFWRWTIGRLAGLRHTSRFDRWVLSEREQFVKARNRELAGEKARQRAAVRRENELHERQRSDHPL